MAIRFDAAADRLLRTANLPDYNAPYSWMAWVYLVSDRNDYGIMFSLDRDDGSANCDLIGVSSDGTSYWSEVVDQSGNYTDVDSGVDFTVGAWAHVAAVRYGPADLRLFYNGRQVGASNTRSVSGRSSAATRMEMGGGWTTANYYLANIRAAGVKVYDAALTEPEIFLEMLYITPQRRAGLNLWMPGRYGADRHYDFSGNGRDWTTGGTLTDEADPPVPWAPPGMLPFWMLDAGAGGTTYDESLSLARSIALSGGANLTIEAGVTLTRADGVSDGNTADLVAAFGLSRSDGVAQAALMDAVATLGLGRVGGLTTAGGLDVHGDLTLGRSLTATIEHTVSMAALLGLSREAGISPSAQADLAAVVLLGLSRAIIASGGLDVSDSVALGRVNALTLEMVITQEVSLALERSDGLSADSQADMIAGLDLTRALGLDIEAGVVISAVISLGRAAGLSADVIAEMIRRILLSGAFGISQALTGTFTPPTAAASFDISTPLGGRFDASHPMIGDENNQIELDGEV